MSTSDDMRRMANYRAYQEWMRSQYGRGPWTPGKRREEDSWAEWCLSYGLDPRTGLPPKTPAERVRETILKEAVS